MNVDRLVKQARELSGAGFADLATRLVETPPLFAELADAVERLQADYDEANARAHENFDVAMGWRTDCHDARDAASRLTTANLRLEARVAALEAERDALLANLRARDRREFREILASGRVPSTGQETT